MIARFDMGDGSFIGSSKPTRQCGQCAAGAFVRPTAIQKPALPMAILHLGHGILNKLQNAAATIAPITTAKTNLMMKSLGPAVTKAPARSRKINVRVAYRSLRHRRYWRIVIGTDPRAASTCSSRRGPSRPKISSQREYCRRSVRN